MAKKKKQKQKLEIVFDNKSRREFLTGFHKRKIERKKRAKDELKMLLKAERKRIRQKVKDSVNNKILALSSAGQKRHLNVQEHVSYTLLNEANIPTPKFGVAKSGKEAEDIAKGLNTRNLVLKAQVLAGGRGKGHFNSVKLMQKSYAPLPDVQHLLDEEEYENEAVQVKIVDLSTDDVSHTLNFIGDNKPKYSDDESPGSGEESRGEPTEDIPGMSMTAKKVTAPKVTVKVDKNIRSKKELDKMTKKKSTQSVRNNNLFKMKAKLDSVAGKKKSRIEKRRKEKQQKKVDKRRGNFNNKAKKYKH